ncbi:hypothetical protein VTJ04DRAFT_2137 [Mycothermus thermophilus]|uniref:uncharacterized protein n=1 Tax=Humicola insolens TaxID=85995 RepID=UPI003743CB15
MARSRFFITGSSDGLGSLTAQRLVSQGYQVVLHARNPERARDAAAACPGADAVLVADLRNIDEIKRLAVDADKLGPYDAIIHNAGVFIRSSGNAKDHSTSSQSQVRGKPLPATFTVNTLAPYLLTCLMAKPKRLVYVSSGMHAGGQPNVGGHGRLDLTASGYSDTKLHNVMLAKAFARQWPEVGCYSVDPGWVPTKMGGPSATGRIEDSIKSFVMLALGEDQEDWTNGGYFYNSRAQRPNAVANDEKLQDELLAVLGEISGVQVPE